MRRSAPIVVGVIAVTASLAFASGSSGVIGVGKITSPRAGDVLPRKYPRCKALNRVYPHGVGRLGARDKTSGDPVTNFKRSNSLYRLNSHLDRDNDKIACEKR